MQFPSSLHVSLTTNLYSYPVLCCVQVCQWSAAESRPQQEKSNRCVCRGVRLGSATINSGRPEGDLIHSLAAIFRVASARRGFPQTSATPTGRRAAQLSAATAGTHAGTIWSSIKLAITQHHKVRNTGYTSTIGTE